MSELEMNFDTVSKMIMEVVDHLGIKKATYAGISLGTLIVKHIVFSYPERVDSCILVGPVGKFTLLLKSAIRLAIVKNAGHICSIDQYEEVNRLIVSFQETGTTVAV